MDLLKLGPARFRRFLQALVEAEEIQRMMVQAIGTAKNQGLTLRWRARRDAP